MAEQKMGFCGRSHAWVGCVLALAALGIGMTCTQGADMDPDLKNLFPTWERSFSASLSGGYNDNVTLSHFTPEASPFIRLGVEAAALRVPLDGTQYSFFITGDYTRYLDGGTVNHEDTVVGQAEVRRQFDDTWQGWFAAEAVYLDQVVDVSITETNLTPVQVRGGTLTARPGVRRDLPNNWWLTLEMPGTRQLYNGELDDTDYWQVGPSLTATRGYGHKSELSLNYALTYRHYDTEPELNDQGVAIPGTIRTFLQNDAVLAWKHHLDKAQTWRTTLAAGWRNNDDSGSGYFDYNRISGTAAVRYRANGWEFSASGRVSQYWFSVQTAGAGDPDLRERTDLTLGLHAQRDMGKHVRLFAEYRHERTLSNLTADEYSVNVVNGGVTVEF